MVYNLLQVAAYMETWIMGKQSSLLKIIIAPVVTIWFNTDTCAQALVFLVITLVIEQVFGVVCEESKHGVRPATEQLKFAAKYLVRL